MYLKSATGALASSMLINATWKNSLATPGPAPSSPSTNPPGGKRNAHRRGKNRGRGGKPADHPSQPRPDADETAAPPSDSVPAQPRSESAPAFKREKGVTFPTVDEIPAVKQVDVASLPEDVRRYREERAKNWPSNAVVERRRAEAEERAARGQLSRDDDESSSSAAAAARRAALREILARQRELGHFEASEEIGDVGGGAGDEEAAGSAAAAAAAGGGGNRKGKGRGGGRDPGAGGDDSAPAKRQRRDAGGAGGRQGTRPCRYWQLGKCRRGDACDFVHAGDAGGNRAGASTGAETCPTISPTNAATNATPCRFFLRGRCKSGRRCAFAHDESAREKAKKDKKAKASSSNAAAGSQTLLRNSSPGRFARTGRGCSRCFDSWSTTTFSGHTTRPGTRETSGCSRG